MSGYCFYPYLASIVWASVLGFYFWTSFQIVLIWFRNISHYYIWSITLEMVKLWRKNSPVMVKFKLSTWFTWELPGELLDHTHNYVWLDHKCMLLEGYIWSLIPPPLVQFQCSTFWTPWSMKLCSLTPSTMMFYVGASRTWTEFSEAMSQINLSYVKLWVSEFVCLLPHATRKLTSLLRTWKVKPCLERSKLKCSELCDCSLCIS